MSTDITLDMPRINARAPRTRKRDIVRALKALADVGLSVTRVKIDTAGNIDIITGQPDDEAADASVVAKERIAALAQE